MAYHCKDCSYRRKSSGREGGYLTSGCLGFATTKVAKKPSWSEATGSHRLDTVPD